MAEHPQKQTRGHEPASLAMPRKLLARRAHRCPGPDAEVMTALVLGGVGIHTENKHTKHQTSQIITSGL